MLEAKGEHPNTRAGVVQVIDDKACASIVNRFNADADKPGFAGMLIDHEHFKHDTDKETAAYGWLMRLQNRADGYYGQIRWTGTGRPTIEDGTYRYFSTEYDPADLEVLSDKRPRRVRPLCLAGLTLTNMNNNKGQRPITNRAASDGDEPENLPEAVQASKAATEASRSADSPLDHQKATFLHLEAAKLQEGVGHPKTADFHRKCADSHKYISESMSGISKNRDTENPMNDDANTAQARLLAEQMAAMSGRSFDQCWQDVKRSHPQLFPVANRQSAPVSARSDSSIRPGATAMEIYHGRQPGEIRNRLAAARPPSPPSEDSPLSRGELGSKVDEYRIAHPGMSFTAAWEALRRSHPGYFGA